jgi:hypothetical protein
MCSLASTAHPSTTAPDHVLPSSKQSLMAHPDVSTTSSLASATTLGVDGASSSLALPVWTVQFYMRATDSKTITARGYNRDLWLLYIGRQLTPETTRSELRISSDSTLHLAARLRSTQHPDSWQLISHIAATTAESKATMTTIAAYSLDELVKKFTI